MGSAIRELRFAGRNQDASAMIKDLSILGREVKSRKIKLEVVAIVQSADQNPFRVFRYSTDANERLNLAQILAISFVSGGKTEAMAGLLRSEYLGKASDTALAVTLSHSVCRLVRDSAMAGRIPESRKIAKAWYAALKARSKGGRGYHETVPVAACQMNGGDTGGALSSILSGSLADEMRVRLLIALIERLPR